MTRAEIPAARALTEVSSDGRQIADLRAGRIPGDFRQNGVSLPHVVVVGDFIQSSQGADTESVRYGSYAVQIGNRLDIAQQLADLVFAGRRSVFKRAHCCLLAVS